MRKRRLSESAALLSLTLCALSAAFWLASSFRPHQYHQTTIRNTESEVVPTIYNLSTDRGRLTLYTLTYHVPLADLTPEQRKLWQTLPFYVPRNLDWPPGSQSDHQPHLPNLLYTLGFDFNHIDQARSARRITGTGVTLPFSVPTVLFAILPATSIALRVRRILRAGPDGKLLKTLPHASLVTLEHERKNPPRRNRLITAASRLSLAILVSLLLTLAVTYPGGFGARFTTPGHRLVLASVQNGYFWVSTIDDWPRPQPLRFFRLSEFEYHFIYPYRNWRVTFATVFAGRVAQQYMGTIALFLEPDGSPMLLPYGHDAAHGSFSPPLPVRRLGLSLPYLALFAALLPTLRLALFARRKLRRRIALNRNLCLTCHYPLTHNTTGTCPECGTPFADIAVKSPSSASAQ